VVIDTINTNFSVAYLHQGGRDGRGMWRGQGKREMHVRFDMKI
jgi:hypothetical protein